MPTLDQQDLEVFYGQARVDLIDFCIATDKNYDPQFFHEQIAFALQKVESGEIKRLIIECPPRHGKSELATIKFPAWYLGRHPDKEVITASYASDLASKFGAQCRDLMREPKYGFVFPNMKLKEDTKAKDYWRTNEGGGYMAVGVGGPATGSGADCIAEGELVETENGLKPIEKIQVGENVLSLNEAKGVLEYRKVLARRCIKDKDVVSLAGRLVCTPDHRVYDGHQYVAAKECRRVYTLLSDKVRFLRKDIREAVYGMEEEKSNKILFDSLFTTKGIKEVVSSVFGLWKENETRIKKGLFRLLSSWEATKKGKTCPSMRSLWKEVYRIALQKSVLLDELQKSFPLPNYAWAEQPQVERWKRASAVQQNFCNYKKENLRTRQFLLRDLFKKSVSRSSFEREEVRRSMGELDNGLQNVSCDYSQIECLRSNEIVSVGKRTVYDIQVEGNQNFFVNNVLVHNCFIIDDPTKNKEEADSETMRDKVWDWYTHVARTRLEKNGAVIIIMTRWHQDDLVGRVLERMKGEGSEPWTRITFKAIAEEDEPCRKTGEALWPEKYSVEALKATRADIQERAWFSLFQQTPIATERQAFRPEWLQKTFTDEDLRLSTVNRYVAIDTADTAKEGRDYIGVVVVDWDSQNQWFLQYVKRYRLNILGLVELIFNLWTQWKPITIGVEKKSFEDQIKPLLKERSEQLGVYPVVVELQHKGRDKESRILGALQGRLEAGKIFFRAGTLDDTDALKRELIDFPASKWDDLSDVTSYISDLGNRPFSAHKDQPTSLAQEIAEYRRSQMRTRNPVNRL